MIGVVGDKGNVEKHNAVVNVKVHPLPLRKTNVIGLGHPQRVKGEGERRGVGHQLPPPHPPTLPRTGTSHWHQTLPMGRRVRIRRTQRRRLWEEGIEEEERVGDMGGAAMHAAPPPPLYIYIYILERSSS